MSMQDILATIGIDAKQFEEGIKKQDGYTEDFRRKLDQAGVTIGQFEAHLKESGVSVKAFQAELKRVEAEGIKAAALDAKRLADAQKAAAREAKKLASEQAALNREQERASAKKAADDLRSYTASAKAAERAQAALNRELDEQKLKTFSGAMENARKNQEGFAQAAGRMIGGIGWKTFAVGATVAATAILGFTKVIVDWADEISDTAENVNLTTTSFQKLTYAFAQGNTDSATFAKSFETLNGHIDDAKQGNKDAIDLFKRLGITLEDIAKLNTEQIFYKSADGLKALNNESEANAIATDLLGKGAKTMAGLYRQGSEAIKNAFKDATVASEKSINRLGYLADEWGKLVTRIKAGGAEMISSLTDFNFNPLPKVPVQKTNYIALADEMDRKEKEARKPLRDDPKEVEDNLKQEQKALEEINKLREKEQETAHKTLTDYEKVQNNNKDIERLKILKDESSFEAQQLEYQIKINEKEKENQDIGKKTLTEVHQEREKLLAQYIKSQKAAAKEEQDNEKKALDIRKDSFATKMEALDLERLSNKEIRDGLANQEKISALQAEMDSEISARQSMVGEAKDASENYSRELEKQLTKLKAQTAEMQRQAKIDRLGMSNAERRAQDRSDREQKRNAKTIDKQAADEADRIARGARKDRSNMTPEEIAKLNTPKDKLLPEDKRPDQSKDAIKAATDIKVDTEKMVAYLETIAKNYGKTI